MLKHSKQMERDTLELTKVFGASGHENDVALIVKKKLSRIQGIRFDKDNLGSLMALKKGTGGKNAPLISLDAHMDEVAFMVSNIDSKGFISMEPLGGWWGHVVLGQLVDISTRNGNVVRGIVGSTPPHILKPAQQKQVLRVQQMFIDVGARNEKEVSKLGINIGDVILPHSESWIMPNGDYIVGKGLDDRAGLAIAIEVMRRLNKVKHESNVMLIGAVQEEVGLRGAKTASYKWTPDVAFAIDVTISNDQPGMEPKPASIGSGVSLSLFDASVISNPKLRRAIESIAKKNKIPFTYDGLAAGGTDAGAIHLARDGVITMVLSIPSRYIHSHNSLVSLTDMQATVDVLVNFIKDFNRNKLNLLKK